MPFGTYFLLSLNDVTISVFRKWYAKAGLIFTLTTLVEICQHFGIEVLGVAFDPFDILMYGIGVSVAATIEKKVFTKYNKYWAKPKNGKM